MITTLSLPDSVFQAYAAMGDKPAQTQMVKQLERFKDFNPQERVLIFPAKERQALEAMFDQPIAPDNFAAFVKWVEERAGVKVDGLQLSLSEGQRKRLKSQADFYLTPYEEYLKQRVQRALDGAI